MSSFWNPNNNPTSSSNHRRRRIKGKQRANAMPLFVSSTSGARSQRSATSSSTRYDDEDLVLVRRKGSAPWWWLLWTKGTVGVTVMKTEPETRRQRGNRVLEPLVEGKVASLFPPRLVDVEE
ncbi:hypothetical protein ASPBRDRAFT_24568 [Aspergillus brasiliensis CBS 101740]|uniref:Uncharacterized protein n=1 Tax=Aspergillus brasiliensis (strain CBS 101740 / IMI 381727 / IBT 21946) TaxID=767769 RepID=A0A1L9UYR3_ASPBC|nr:hypothetical protein ASPBRDRAFT_24568 [Aspergillus brasiliensis CBS 101740]